jgi:hypothetical protein
MRRLLEPSDLLAADTFVLGPKSLVGGSGSRERQH